MLFADHNKKLSKELLDIELKLRDKLSWGEKLSKTKPDLTHDSLNQRVLITTLHKEPHTFKKELLTDQHKKPSLSDPHLQVLKEQELLTLQVDTADTEWPEAHSKLELVQVHSNLV